jgi:small-conductance mechanosensitive channel
MLKKYLYFPLSAGVFAALVTVAYSFAYESAQRIEGEQLESLREAIPMTHLILAPIIACLVAAAGYFSLKKFLPKAGSFLFYFSFSTISILTSFAIIFVNGLHEEVQFIATGYAMPMHFFPFLSWVSFKSLFFQD